MPKYNSLKDLQKAQAEDLKAKVLFEEKTEKVKAEIAAQIEELTEKIADAQAAADYDRYEGTRKQISALEDKMNFYNGSSYRSTITDKDLSESWVALHQSFEDKKTKLYNKFLSCLDSAIEIYKEFADVYKDELGTQWAFCDALDHSKFSPAGFPEVKFPDLVSHDLTNDFSLRHRMTEKAQDNGFSYNRLFDLINRKIPS